MTMEANEKLVKLHQKKVFASEAAILTADIATAFHEWANNLRNEKRGGVLLYDIPTHCRYLEEKELFDYFINHVYQPL